MNNKHQENGPWTGLLIFTVPAYGFVTALYLDWLDGTNRAGSCVETFPEKVEPVEAVRSMLLK